MVNNKKLLAGMVVAAMAGSVHAGVTVTGTTQTFAAQDVANNSTVIVPTPLIVIQPQAVGDVLIINDVIKFTLPSGLTFKQNPALTATGAGAATIQGSATGTDTAIFKITTAQTAATDTFSLTNVAVNGTGGPLASKTVDDLGALTALNIKVELARTTAGAAVNGTNTSLLGAGAGSSPSNQGVLRADNVFGITPGTASNLTVDIISVNGTKFDHDNTQTTPSLAYGALTTGTITVTNTAGLVNSLGAAFSLPATTTGSLTVTGDFTGVTSTYLDTAACASTKPSSAISGTVASGTATYTGLVVGTTYRLCQIVDGTTLLPQVQPFKANLTAVNGSYTLASSGNYGTQTYNGSTATARFVNPVSNTTNPSYVKLYNPNAAAAKISGIRYLDDGTSTAFTTVEAAMPANGSKLYAASDLATIFGSWSGKAHFRFFSTQAGGLNAQALVQSPIGVVSNVSASE